MSEPDFLVPGRVYVAGQLLVSETGTGGVPNFDLAFEQFAQQPYRIGSSLQGQTQIGRHLAHCVIVRVLRENLHILLQGISCFAFLEKLFCTLDVSGDLGPVYSLGIWHESRVSAE